MTRARDDYLDRKALHVEQLEKALLEAGFRAEKRDVDGWSERVLITDEDHVEFAFSFKPTSGRPSDVDGDWSCVDQVTGEVIVAAPAKKDASQLDEVIEAIAAYMTRVRT